MSGLIGILASGAVSNLVSPTVDRLLDLIPDPEKRAEEAADAAAALLAADQSISTQQNAINLQEAKSENLFVSGWRPFIGWSCGVAMLWQVLLAPFVDFNLAVFGFHPVLPHLDRSWIDTLLVPLLGLGAMRTVEKVQRVAGPLMGTAKPMALPPTAATQVPTATGVQRPMVRPVVLRPGAASSGGGVIVPVAFGEPRRDPDTLDIMARTLWGEARSEGLAGMEAVASVILRRAKYPRWWGDDIRSVCLKRAQFSCWLPQDPNRDKLLAVTEADAEFAQAIDIAERAMKGVLADRTFGADHYVNLSVLPHPSWVAMSQQTAVINKHTFFRLEI